MVGEQYRAALRRGARTTKSLELWKKIKYGISDPVTALKFISSGSSGVTRSKLRQLLGSSKSEIEAYYRELDDDEELNGHINNQIASTGTTLGQLFSAFEVYVICRIKRPLVAVETGVCAGVSSAYILRALEKNGQGRLYSIDLPNYKKLFAIARKYRRPKPVAFLPPGKQVGFAVPQALRHRWDLRLGLSSSVLPNLLNELGEIDLFLHDSEHSYENMLWEYRTAWPHIRDGGIILSDDVDWNEAFFDFCKEAGRRPVHVYSRNLAGVVK